MRWKHFFRDNSAQRTMCSCQCAAFAAPPFFVPRSIVFAAGAKLFVHDHYAIIYRRSCFYFVFVCFHFFVFGFAHFFTWYSQYPLYDGFYFYPKRSDACPLLLESKRRALRVYLRIIMSISPPPPPALRGALAGGRTEPLARCGRGGTLSITLFRTKFSHRHSAGAIVWNTEEYLHSFAGIPENPGKNTETHFAGIPEITEQIYRNGFREMAKKYRTSCFRSRYPITRAI